MALRSVMHSHPCRNFPPVTVTALDSLPILPDLAKDLNLPPDSALAIPRHPADLSSFDQAVSVRGQDSVMGRAVYRACPSSADSSDSRDSVPGFAESVVADYSSPAVDLAFVGQALTQQRSGYEGSVRVRPWPVISWCLADQIRPMRSSTTRTMMMMPMIPMPP